MCEDFISNRKKALEVYFSRMNDRQREAVFTVKGPVLILAGAGSGKTTVLINRIANLIAFGNAYYDEKIPNSITEDEVRFLAEYKGDSEDLDKLRDICAVDTVNPYNILAITFTNKAAAELRARLSAMLGDDVAKQISAKTFHSACMYILRREIHNLGFRSDFTIYDADDSQRMVKVCLEYLDISEKNLPPRSVANEISSAKEKLITPEVYSEEAGDDFRRRMIGKVYTEYQKRLKEANALDFDDIICHTVELFEKFPDVLDHYQNLYKYIMVDEYQDTNTAQFRLVELLSQKYRNLCVVGDDDQSIYKFRGATIENILGFEDFFLKNDQPCKVIKLEQNYRSTQNILSAANCVVRNNTNRNDKSLWTDKGEGEKISVYKAPDEATEARYIADIIRKGVENEGKKYSDYCILYRVNAQSNNIERNFSVQGMPYRVIGGMKFYDRKEIKDIIAYLSVINNPSDILRFRRIVNEPKRGIGETTVTMIEQIASDLGDNPISVMRNAEELAPLAKKSATLIKFAHTLDKLSAYAEEHPLDKLIDELIDKTGYLEMLKKEGDEGETRLENIRELKSTIVEYITMMEDSEEEPTLSGFLEQIALYTDIDKLDDETDAVTMMTIHSAKGLEFPNVFIAGMEEGIFPGIKSASDPAELEEERRLAYVAITRAKEKLYITHSQVRMLYGQTNRNLQSRFIKEIDADLLDKKDGTVRMTRQKDKQALNASNYTYNYVNEIATRNVAKQSASSGNTYSVGDSVKHPKFGKGTVITAVPVGGDTMLEIAFEEVGTKKLMANFVKMTKI